MPPVTTPLDKMPLTTDRQRELLRIVEKKFGEFAQRNQQYYPLLGMSTHHIVNAVIADIQALRIFWPKDRIRDHGPLGGVSYMLEDDVMEKAQDAVRATLVQLAEKNYLERVGNENERRWRPLGIVSQGRIVNKAA